MGPRAAIIAGVRNSMRFSGRTTRSDFWWFAPVAIVPPIVAVQQIDWSQVEIWGIWRLLVVMCCALPLLSAASRRLQDTGEDGHQAIYPFMPFIVLWFGYQTVIWIGPILGPAVFFVWFLALIILVPLHIIAFIGSLIIASSVLGMMLVPSQPGRKRFGANPFEVAH